MVREKGKKRVTGVANLQHGSIVEVRVSSSDAGPTISSALAGTQTSEDKTKA